MDTLKKILFGSLSAALGLALAEGLLAVASLIYPIDSVLLTHRFAAESPYFFPYSKPRRKTATTIRFWVGATSPPWA